MLGSKMNRRVLGKAILFSVVTLSAVPAWSLDRLKVAIVGADAEITWTQVKRLAADKGLQIDVVAFNDFIVPNAALDAGDVDVAAFQTRPHLELQVSERNFRISPVGSMYLSPLGLYSKRFKRPEDLPEGATVALANDASNLARMLLFMQNLNLIKLTPGAGQRAALADIVENPKKLKFVELDPGLSARSLDDVSATFLPRALALMAGLKPKGDAIATEPLADNPFVLVMSARTADKDNPLIKKLVSIFQSPENKNFIETRFEGGIIPAW